jgi:hypothetical protein
MSVLDRVKADLKRFVESKELFSIDLKITSANGSVIEIPGVHTKHHLSLNSMGNKVSSKNAHVAFHESTLTDQGWTIRNGDGEVDLKNWLVEAKDSTDISKKYKIIQWFPNESTGLVVCILGDYK